MPVETQYVPWDGRVFERHECFLGLDACVEDALCGKSEGVPPTATST